MNIILQKASARCAVFELDSATHYYAPAPFTVYLNEKEMGVFDRNCFTLSALEPDSFYQLRVTLTDGQSAALHFRTQAEQVRFNVCDFGAKGDGCSDSGAAIQAAINCCPTGGTVYLPAGAYLSGPLFLKSGITLYLEKNAILRGSIDRSRYPVLPGMLTDSDGNDLINFGTWEGNPLSCHAALITAIDAQDLCICGEGIIDGNGAQGGWWENPKAYREVWRPRTVFLCRCSNVTMMGVTVRNSPSWTVHPYYSDKLHFLDISIQNPDDSPNTDGLDPESCQQVNIIGTRISVGDDCISIKSGKRYMAQYHHKDSRDILVRNCLLERGHGAVVIGSEISGGVSQVLVERCLMRGTDRGLRVKTRRGRGATSVVDGLVYQDITMEQVRTPFVINMFYFCDPDGKSKLVSDKQPRPVDAETPRVGSLTLRNIVCTDAEQAAMFFYGLPEQPIELVDAQDVSISFAAQAQAGYPAMMSDLEPMCKSGIFAGNVSTLRLERVTLQGHEGARIITAGTTNIEEV